MKSWRSVYVLGLVSLLGVVPTHAQGPSSISGRVVMESGQPVPEPIGVEFACNLRVVQAILTDGDGYFTFNLAAMSVLGGLPQRVSGSLVNCEVRVSAAGYYPLSYPVEQQPGMGSMEIGTLKLQRIASVPGSYVSLTSLLVPDNARKEFEKALKDLEKNRFDSAQQHLEKAVSLYPAYAAAWNALGQRYLASRKPEEAKQSFEKAITADSHYIQPYLNLASLQLQNQQWQDAVGTAGKILEQDSSIGLAHYMQAVGNFNLHHLEAAEKGAREAEKQPHERIPHVHVLLAEIFLQKQDYKNAAAQMRTYLEEAPDGSFAARVKKGLADIESAGTSYQKPRSAPAEAKP